MTAFSPVDILRMGAGLVLLNALFSALFTGTATWGYEGRLLDPRYYIFRGQALVRGQHPVHLSPEQLALYNGSDPGLPIYVAVGGKVYDVTASRALYGPPRGRYAAMSGSESARMLVTGCVSRRDHLTADLRGLDQEQALAEIAQWQHYFESKSKYWLVGYVDQHVDPAAPVPAPCEAPLKAPAQVRSTR